MVKINNKGFSLSTEIVFIFVFFIFLISMMIISYRNGMNKNSQEPKFEKKNEMFVLPEEKEK